MKFKLGDTVNIYGEVVTNHTHDFKGTSNYCRGTQGVVLYQDFDSEMGVLITKEPVECAKGRSLIGKTVVVHPKQCRKVKKKVKK